MSNSTIITLENVYKSYYLSNGNEIPVLRGIDIAIQKHEFVALMGESGGGKSTLLNILGCLHPISSGSYFLEGENIGNVRDDDVLAFIRNKKMGFIFQQFNLISRMTALKNVALPAFYGGIDKKDRENKAQEILKSVGLADRIHHRPSELSGGQQQRVSIARSLINNPEIILADEPTGALDSKTGAEILEVFQNFKKQKKTVIMVTHALEVAEQADRIIFLKDGKVIDHNYKIK